MRDRWKVTLVIFGAVVAFLVSGYLALILLFGAFTSTPLGGMFFPDEWIKGQQRSHQESFMFWGKVVDASGQPVEGAKVTVLLKMPGSQPNREENICITDSRGLFEFDGYGSSLGIVDVEGPGDCLYEKNISTDSLVVRSTMSFRFSRTTSTLTYLPDSNRPAIFVLVNKGDLIQVWPSRGGQDSHLSTGRVWNNDPLRPRRPSVDIVDTPQGPVAGDVYNQATRRYPGRE